MNAGMHPSGIRIVTDRAGLEPLLGGVLVPTMGALHRGHRELVQLARRIRDERGLSGPVMASLFVNPAQFNEAKDFDMYPRDLEADAHKAAESGCEVIFAPSVEEMYPGGREGAEWSRPVDLPGCVVGKGMEDEYRPGHFQGVYLVCRRLLELCRPAAAVFGEKDWQQLQLVKAMSEREGLGVEIIGGKTVREDDGLALSSRNVHLRPEDRGAALGLSRGIRVAQRLGQAGGSAAEAEAAGRDVMRRAVGDGFEYFEVRDAESCGEVVEGKPARVLCAAKVGVTRLIDNDHWGLAAQADIGGRSVQELVGEQLSAVSFVQDYVELHFDGSVIRCLVRPIVEVTGSASKRFGDGGYRDLLCSFIGQILRDAKLDADRELRLNFESAGSLSVPLDEEGREGLPEALNIQVGSGKDGWTQYI